jgi:hypothetical protein
LDLGRAPVQDGGAEGGGLVMIQRISVAAGLACILAACSPPAQQNANTAPGAAAGGIQPGQYRTTVTMLEMNIPGVPAQNINMQPITTEDCVTSSDVAEFTQGSMVNADSGETCTQSSMNTAGGRIQGQSSCTGPYGARTMQINGSYTANHVEMEINSTSDMPGGGGQMSQRMRIVTERLGECPAGETAD